MTLSTNVYVQGPVDVDALWDACQALIGSRRPRWDVSDSWRAGLTTRANEPDQGFSAWLIMHYRADGAEIPAETCGEYCGEGCDYQHAPAYYVDVDFETAYSYQDEYGGCGDLHARIVEALGGWLDKQGIPWSWRNEFTAEIHVGREGLDALGAEAQRWMTTVVLPAIQAGEL